jgi:serine/threonine protein kinase/tetratricopeptide (TPR) repeat protein
MTDDKTRNSDPDDGERTIPLSESDADATISTGPSSQIDALERPGSMIGHFKLGKVLGEGGFGTVYLAEQLEPVKRQVALKIIKLGMDTKNVIARFEAEKQALALMDHPGIAKVFDAGSTATGRPYFVMELVEGVPVTQYCDQHRLSTRRRLELFSEICSAVQHAHQKGVIHRDIKPSNVLVSEVDGLPVPKVIDFGIAKATSARLTEKTLFTQEAQFIGTPAYMSPEQTGISDLDVDTRSDIYSLGVLLYEMLSGSTPFDSQQLLSAGFAEIQRIIREDEPPMPSSKASRLGDKLDETAEYRQLRGSQLVKRLKGELDWIVMKCLEKDRSRRYETANGLARDVVRFLSNEPVTASPPSRTYRLKKLMVRNRAVFAAGTAMVLLLAAGVVGTSIGLVRAKQAEREAVSEASKSEQVARFLTDMLAGVGPSAARGRDTEMLEEILQETHESIGVELADQPEVEGEIRSHLGQTYYDLGRLEQAKEQWELARDLLTEAHGEFDADVARQYSNLGLVHEALQEFKESEAAHLKALELRRQVFDGPHDDLAMNLVNIANLYVNIGRYEEAEPMLLEGLEQLRQIHGNENENVAIALNSLGNLMQHLRRYPEAGPYYEEALEIHTAVLGDDHPFVITDMFNLGWLALNTEKLEEASQRFAEVAALSRRVYTEPHPNLIIALDAQAKTDRKLERLESAETLHRESIALAEQVYGADHPSTAELVLALGETLSQMGRLDEADQQSVRAIEILETAFGPDDRVSLRARYNYAYSVYDRGDIEKAIPMLEESVAAYTAAVGREHDSTALTLSNLGRALRDIGRLDESIAPLTEALDIRLKIMGPEHMLVGVSNHDLAKANFFRGRLDEAETQLREALSNYTVSLDSAHRVFGTIQILLARIDLDQGQPEEALECLQKGRPLSLAARGADHEEMLDFDTLEAVARGRLGDLETPESLIADVTPRLDEFEPKKRALLQLNLGQVHTLTEHYEDAERALLESQGTFGEIYGTSHYLTQQSVQALIAMYDGWAQNGSTEAAEAARRWRRER